MKIGDIVIFEKEKILLLDEVIQIKIIPSCGRWFIGLNLDTNKYISSWENNLKGKGSGLIWIARQHIENKQIKYRTSPI